MRPGKRTPWRSPSVGLLALLLLAAVAPFGALAAFSTVLAVSVRANDAARGNMAQSDTERHKSQRMVGTWHGERYGMDVTWRFEANGRMRLEERAATWQLTGDSLVVDFEPLGESGRERAVYLYLLSDLEYGPRRMFIRGFDLGSGGVLLTRERDEIPTSGSPSRR